MNNFLTFFFLSVFFHVLKENVKDNTLSVLTMPVLFNGVLFYDFYKDQPVNLCNNSELVYIFRIFFYQKGHKWQKGKENDLSLLIE